MGTRGRDSDSFAPVVEGRGTLAHDGGGPLVDPVPLIRLWQAVIVTAIADASHQNEHRDEARLWIKDPVFDPLCEFVGFNPAEIKAQLDDTDLHERIRATCKRPTRSRDD